MQEEVTQKTIALSMKTGKLTAQALQARGLPRTALFLPGGIW